MLLSKGSTMTSVPSRQMAPVSRGSSGVVHATKTPAWESWNTWMKTRKVKNVSSGKAPTKSTIEIAGLISKKAADFKPQYKAPPPSTMPSLKLTHIVKIDTDSLPADMHERMEVITSMALKNVVGKDELDAASLSFTTTDIDAALTITGVTLQAGAERTAVICFAAAETVREASWSRLEGLLLHWACAESPAGAWSMPPEGWKASPSNVKDAGGAWQCVFEHQKLMGNQDMYVTMLQIPLKGALKSGGMVFVLKAPDGQNTRWLKDAGTDKDFFLDLQKLPVIKV